MSRKKLKFYLYIKKTIENSIKLKLSKIALELNLIFYLQMSHLTKTSCFLIIL